MCRPISLVYGVKMASQRLGIRDRVRQLAYYDMKMDSQQPGVHVSQLAYMA